VDVWGREIRDDDTALRVLNNLLLPAFVSRISEPAFDSELGRLYETFAYKERLPQGVDAEEAAQLRNMVYPSAAPQTITYAGESGHRLSDEDYTELARATGKLKYTLAAEYINSETYAQLDDIERAEGLDLIYRYANSIARYDLYGDKAGTTKSDIAARDMAKSVGLSVGGWLTVRKRLNAAPPEGATDAEKRQLKTEKGKFLVGLGLGAKETYAIANAIGGMGVNDDNIQPLTDNSVPPATYFEAYAKYGNDYRPARDTALIARELKLDGPTAQQYWNRAQTADPNLANRITAKLNAIKAISALSLPDNQKVALASALGIGVNANDIQEAIAIGIAANDALRYAVMQDAYAAISKTKGNNSSLTAMMFASDALDDPKYTPAQKSALYGIYPMYQIIPVNADVEDIAALKAAGVSDWLPLRAKWVELGENGDEDSAKNYKYALWLYRESGRDIATQELIAKAANSSAYQSSASYANAVYKGAVLENHAMWPLWDEWTQYKREIAKANGKTSISSQEDINAALNLFSKTRDLTGSQRQILYAFSTTTKASKQNVSTWGKQSLARLSNAA
jgi:hypothetical protein